MAEQYLPTWEDIANSERFRSLPFSEREQVRNDYFSDFIQPKVPPGALREVRSSFDRDTKQTDQGEFSKGLSAGWRSMKSLGGAFVGALGQAAGADPVRDWGINVMQVNEEAARRFAPKVGTIEEIDYSPGKFIDWAAYTLGSLTPFALESAATGIAGAVLGSAVPGAGTAAGAVAGLAGKTALKEAIKAYAKGELKDEATKAVAKNAIARFGATSGLIAGSYPLGVGDVYRETVEAGEPSAGLAFAAGVPYAALDIVPELMIAKRLGVMGMGAKAAKEAADGIVKRYGKGTLIQGIAESGAEGGQELVNLLAHKAVDPSFDISSPESRSRIANAMAAGALGGAVTGGVSGALARPGQAQEGALPPAVEGLLAPPSSTIAGPEGFPTDIEGVRELDAARQAAAQVGAERAAEEARVAAALQALKGAETVDEAIDAALVATAGPVPSLPSPAGAIREMQAVTEQALAGARGPGLIMGTIRQAEQETARRMASAAKLQGGPDALLQRVPGAPRGQIRPEEVQGLPQEGLPEALAPGLAPRADLEPDVGAPYALPQRGAAALPLREAPGDRPALGEGDTQRQAAAGAQALAQGIDRQPDVTAATPLPEEGLPSQAEAGAAGLAPPGFPEAQEREGGYSKRTVDTLKARGFKVVGNRISGAPPEIDTVQKVTGAVTRMANLSGSEFSVAADKDWYKRAGVMVRDLTRGNQALREKTTRLLAKLSQAQSVGGNVGQLVKAAYQLARGETPAVGRYPNVFKKEVDALLSAEEIDTDVPGVNLKLREFYRGLADEVYGTDRWPDSVVIDRHMYRLIFNAEEKVTGGEAQYAFGKRVVQLATDRYNEEHGTNLKPRELQALLWGAQINRTSGKKGPYAPARNFPEYFEARTARVTAEALPSKARPEHPVLKALPAATRRAFLEEAHAIVREDGQDLIAQKLGIPLYESQYSTGGFEGGIQPNVVTGIVTEYVGESQWSNALAEAYAAAWQFIYRQDAVPWFRADPDLRPKRQGPIAQGYAIRFAGPLSEADEQRFFDDLRQALGEDAGYTKEAPDRVVVINYRGGDGLPFLLPDAEFTSKLRDMVNSWGQGITETVGFGAETSYITHDWSADHEGLSVLQRVGQAGRPDFQAWLRDRQREADALAAKYAQAPGAGVGVAETVTGRRPGEPEGVAEPGRPYEPTPQQLELIYDEVETRPGTTEEQRSLGVAALRALFSRDRRAGGTILGSTLWKDFQERAGAELLGKAAATPQELALAAQILRDPRFETMRVFYVKDGKVVGHTGWSSRLPGSVAFSITGPPTGARGGTERVYDMQATMASLGADGYYLMHNHPSGSAEPSGADIELTAMIDNRVAGFKGHIVIDHEEFSVIGSVPPGRLALPITYPLPASAIRADTEAELIHDVLNKRINDVRALARVGKQLTSTRPGYVTLISTGGGRQTRVKALAEIPAHLLERGKTRFQELRAIARVRRFMKMTSGAGHAFIVGEDPERFNWLARRNVITDAVSPEGKSLRQPGGGTDTLRSRTVFEAREAETPAWAKELTPAQQASLRKSGVIVKKATVKERVRELTRDFSKDFIQGVFDQFAPIKEFDPIAYMKARLSKATDGGVEAALLYGKPILRDGAIDVRASDGGFLKVLQGLRGEHDRFFAWVAGQRAAQLAAAGKENLLTDEDISFLRTLHRPDASWPERASAYRAVQQELRAFNKAIMDIAEQQGLLDAESRPLWESEFYVPFYRVLEDGVAGPTVKSGLVRQYAFKKLKGGRENLNDLLKNTLMNWSHLLSAAQKNAAAKATLDAAEKMGIAIEADEDTVRQMGKSAANRKGVVNYLENGKERWFLVDDPHLLEAITAIEWAGFGPWMKPVAAFKRWMSFGVTANPGYKLRNIMRDSIAAIAQNPMSYNVFENVRKGWRATGAGSQTRASMLAGGGLFRFGTILEGDRAQHLKKLIAAGVPEENVLDTPTKVKAFFTKIWDLYQETGDRAENANRAALYEDLIAQGKSHLEASYLARDMLDFSMQGKWAAIRFLTMSVPFLNARLQGLYKLGRAAREDPARAGYVTAAIAAASLAILIGNEDDEDWKKREAWDRDTYWWFKFGGNAYRIPKPFELGAIGTITERTYELMFDDEMTVKKYGKRMADIASQQFSMSPVPQLFKPMVDVYANTDAFTGRAIETMGMERLRKEDRYTNSTTYLSRFVGQLGLPDPVQLAQGRYEALSPVQSDAILRGYFGWLGTMVATAADYGIRPLVGAPEKPAMRLRDVFLAGQFVEGLPSNQSRYVTEFYEQAKEIEQAYGSWRQALKQGETERAAEIYEEEREKIGKYRAVSAIKRREAELNARARQVELSSADAETKRRLLDMLAAQKDRLARRISP